MRSKSSSSSLVAVTLSTEAGYVPVSNLKVLLSSEVLKVVGDDSVQRQENQKDLYKI